MAKEVGNREGNSSTDAASPAPGSLQVKGMGNLWGTKERQNAGRTEVLYSGAAATADDSDQEHGPGWGRHMVAQGSRLWTHGTDLGKGYRISSSYHHIDITGLKRKLGRQRVKRSHNLQGDPGQKWPIH